MTTSSTKPFDETRCIGVTRDLRTCHARAIEQRTSATGDTLDVCGTHGIAFDETRAAYGDIAATFRILTGTRP